MPIYIIRTTGGQERNVAHMVAVRAVVRKIPIKAVVAPPRVKGYIFVEADAPHYVDEAIAGVAHARSRLPQVAKLEEVENLLVSKPIIDELAPDQVVEVISGPFKGAKAKVMRVDKAREEVTIEILDAAYRLPVTVPVDYVKLVKGEVRWERRER